MAQLARCPACYTELELPAEAAEGDRANTWVKCPACEESFAVADAKPRVVKQAQVSVAPSRAADQAVAPPSSESQPSESKSVEPTPSESTASGLSDSLLDSFLSNDPPAIQDPAAASTPTIEPRDEVVEDASTDEVSSSDSSMPSLGQLKSLEDLFRGGKEPVEATPPPSEADDASDFGTKETIDLEEPVPAADRRRPTLGELFAESKPADSPQDSGSYDPVEETAEIDKADSDAPESETLETETSDEELSHRENKRTSSEFDEMTLHDFATPSFDSESNEADSPVAATTEDAPSFDQLVSDQGDGPSADELDDSKSLRASMGFPATDEPLEVQDEELEPVGVTMGEEDDELNFAKVDAPRGVVASRKRKSSFSVVRTMLGIVLGGMFGLYAGYLVILWVKVADPLNAANLYPDAIKPQAMRSEPAVGPQSSLAQAPESSESDTEATDEQPGGVDTASFTTDVTDNEPPAWDFDAEPANPAATEQPSVEINILDAPQYTAAELQRLTAASEEAAPYLVAPGKIGRTKGSSYATIAKLADALTFGEGDADASWNNAAREVFPPLFDTGQARGQISQIAGFWLTSPKRKHGGIFFCGAPDAGRQAGSVAEYEFTLPGGQALTVLTPQVLAENVTSAPTVVVVGSVIDQPADHIEGYTGAAEMAIWSENLLPAGN
ncbi:hypothetical protein [Aeoliella straminimaris]|nr:hypothetical protein [Aeoliella straminimaris]